MGKYVVEIGGTEGAPGEGDPVYIMDLHAPDSLFLTTNEAQARIIAFALNAVAEGSKLTKFTDKPCSCGCGNATFEHYDGPTL